MRRFETRFMWWRKAKSQKDMGSHAGAANSTFRLFFDLIERLERPQTGLETKSAPQRKARISLLGPDAKRGL